jgi:DNA mismatch endonuclease (patch repair protein)
VNGCFWHGHRDCKYAKLPATNIEFWKDKINGNKERDRVVHERLTELKWHVITIWQCELKPSVKEKTFAHLLSALKAWKID